MNTPSNISVRLRAVMPPRAAASYLRRLGCSSSETFDRAYYCALIIDNASDVESIEVVSNLARGSQVLVVTIVSEHLEGTAESRSLRYGQGHPTNDTKVVDEYLTCDYTEYSKV